MKKKKSIVAFDIDGTLCKLISKNSNGINKYKHAKPDYKNIKHVNLLFEEGHYIKIYTARGMTTFNKNLQKIKNKYLKLTIKQLKDWNVNYNELIFGKESYDYLIDDKVINVSDINKIKKVLKKLTK